MKFTKSQIALIHRVQNKMFATCQIDTSDYREKQAMRKLVKDGVLVIVSEKHGYQVTHAEVNWQSDIRVMFS